MAQQLLQSLYAQHRSHHTNAHKMLANEHANMVILLKKITNLDTVTRVETWIEGVQDNHMIDIDDND